MNLLRETLEILSSHEKSPSDVRWVGSPDMWMTWDAFARRADVEYDDGFGGQEVAIDLLVVGDGWWLERHDYDGSEWWEYKEQPRRPTVICPADACITEGQRRAANAGYFAGTLAEMQPKTSEP